MANYFKNSFIGDPVSIAKINERNKELWNLKSPTRKLFTCVDCGIALDERERIGIVVNRETRSICKACNNIRNPKVNETANPLTFSGFEKIVNKGQVSNITKLALDQLEKSKWTNCYDCRTKIELDNTFTFAGTPPLCKKCYLTRAFGKTVSDNVRSKPKIEPKEEKPKKPDKPLKRAIIF